MLDRILDWLDASPERYAFQAFPSEIQDEGETVLSVVALGVLQGGMFFGYQGFESFWGGAMSRRDVDRIFAHLRAERTKLGR